MATMKEFLLQYYMQLRFNRMPAEVRAKYDDYLKANDFRGHMGDWQKKLMTDGKQNEMPNPTESGGDWELSNAEWENLFAAFQKAFRGMAANKSSFEYNKDANEFLNEYFGGVNTHLFSNAVANPVAEMMINNEFKKLLVNKKDSLSLVLKDWRLLDDGFSYKDLLDGIDSKKYNSSVEFQDKIKTIAQYLTNYMDAELKNRIKITDDLDFSDIQNGFEDVKPSKEKWEYFKNNYRTLLDTLYTKTKVMDVFAQYDNGKISKPFNKAKENVNYDDKNSDDYIPPKRDDELTAWQQLNRWVGDTWSDYMDKYMKLRGDRMYLMPSAKSIVQALDGAKFRPNDGLGKVLENAGKIKEGLRYKSPTATKHFEWLEKVLAELKDTMPKAFDGALKNGRQMRAIVSEIISRAVRDNKMAEAKATLEVLSIIKYGYTTSNTMDALGKEKVSIFSDSKLSWNKNEGMQFVSKAMDQSIRAAFMGVGYAITMSGNAVRLSGSKFNGKLLRMKKGHEDYQNNIANQKSNKQQELNNKRDLLAAEEEKMRKIGISDIENEKRQLQDNQNEIQRLIETDDVKKLNKKIKRKNELNQDLERNKVAILYRALTPKLKKIKKEIEEKIEEVETEEDDLKKTSRNVKDFINLEKDVQEQEPKIREYENACANIDELNNQINKRETELNEWDENHKDNYRELMAYWDFLETGRDTHTGKLYSWRLGRAKVKQKRFDAQKDALVQQFTNGYGKVA